MTFLAQVELENSHTIIIYLFIFVMISSLNANAEKSLNTVHISQGTDYSTDNSQPRSGSSLDQILWSIKRILEMFINAKV